MPSLDRRRPQAHVECDVSDRGPMTGAPDHKPALTVLLCSPRGFCAGVVRAIETVEQALARYGAPVYVRHEIVHNRYVVESLKAKGAIFVEELARFLPPDPGRLAYVTQTTLSVDDTAGIIAALKARFPHIHGPHKEDICYATTNRQEVVKKVAPMVEAMVVVGSPNSSNTQRLKEVAERAGCPRAALVQRAKEIDWSLFGSIASLGVTAGASAPEVLVEEVIGA